MNLHKPITVLKGIGNKKAEGYFRIGIKTIQDLIEYYPRTYEVSTGFSKISEIEQGKAYMVRGKVCTDVVTRRAGRMIITTVTLRDESGEIIMTWFNQPYIKSQLKRGEEIVVKGKVSLKYNRLQFNSPKLLTEKDLKYLEENTVLPIYALSKKLSQKMLRLTIAAAIELTSGEVEDFLPNELLEKYDLMNLEKAINQVHYPDGELTLEKARKRLIFDEFLLFQLGLMMLKEDQGKIKNQFEFIKHNGYENMLDELPYKLTNAQSRVMKEILKDLTGPYNMNRLIQGDVGSGKTIVSILGMMLAVENGYQSALMAPTEVLAKQHYKSLLEAFDRYDIKVGLLVGSMTKKQKMDIYERIEAGVIDIVIGTHAVIQEGVKFKNLALVITDEQHRFGVNQREILAGKGQYPHVIVMSATPIPRTLALILYGDMDISIIDEMPPGRQTIETYTVTTSYRDRINKFMEKEVEQLRQCYIVCPMVEENEEMELEDVISYSERLKDDMPPNIRINYLHGKMRPKEKNAIMEAFVKGDIDIIVSTTVIEVGINVPNATVMLIENAERFGLAQLHQLRGRVGRGEHKSYCVLITDSKSSQSKKRMEIMTKTADGFIISEKDLELRGHGDLLGIRQSGLPAFKIASILEDAKILKEANHVAKTIRENHDILLEEDYKYLKNKIDEYVNKYMLYIAL